ncbi:MAG: putative salt-induced outer membrane protein [Gammaproteobacteria bacterium]|jgi:putative salt-induced outer membrane protein|nr:putative salt-induced outer membrane protein [Gammaproteobacteria bacterium]
MTNHPVLAAASLLLAASSLTTARADDPPAPPPQHQWIGKGQFGFLSSKGNSDGQSINGNIDMTRYDDSWKNEAYAEGLYGKSAGIISAERWLVRGQTDYTFTTNTFTFGGLRFEHDLFDGFVYQASITAGIGYKFINTDNDKLTAQAGPGFRRIRPETLEKDANGAVVSRVPQAASSEVIATGGIDYLHKFTATTSLTNKFLVEHGSTDTLAHDEIALAVKMSTRLALSVGYAVTHNSNPPSPLKKIDTVTTVNLVFAF